MTVVSNEVFSTLRSVWSDGQLILGWTRVSTGLLWPLYPFTYQY